MKTWKQTMKKVGALVLALAMVVTMVSFPTKAKAASVTMTGGEVLYLVPNSNWNQAGARFAMYVFGEGNDNNAWASMTDKNNDGTYEGTVPVGKWTTVIFCRMDPNSQTNSWNTKWNQSADLGYDGTNNTYTVSEGTWDNGGGTWSTNTVHPDIKDGSDGYCDECGLIKDANLAGYTLSLDGNIGVNFYMELPQAIAEDSSAHAEITYPGGDPENPIKVQVIDDLKKTYSGKEYYVFTCEVAAKDMTGEITLQMKTDKGAGKTYTYTVKDYAEYIINNPTQYKEAEVAFAKALLNYGAYSQEYFGVNIDNLATNDKDVSKVTETFADYRADIASSAVGTFTSANLSLKSETMVNVVFKANAGAGNLTFTVDEKEVTPEHMNVEGVDYYRISVANINAANLEDSYTFTVTNGDETSEMTYGAFSYAYSVLSGDYEESLKNVVKALWLLNEAAKGL